VKTVGEILKKERERQKRTLLQIHRETRIPEKTLIALEDNDFTSLPPATFIKGFIQIYAKSLGLNSKRLIAIFRRDWQKRRKTEVVPQGLTKPLNKLVWTPKMTTFLIIGFIFVPFLGYLAFQLKNFFSPPPLVIETPLENEQIKEKSVAIKGKTEKDASVYVNDKLINIDEEGGFSYQLKLFPGENMIIITAVNRRGKQTSISRRIQAIEP